MLQDISFISHCSPSLSTSAPPLTVDNVLTTVQGVDWWTLGRMLLPSEGDRNFEEWGPSYPEVERIGQQYKSNDDRLHVVVETYVHGDGKDKEPSWRSLIWRLGGGNIASIADIRHFAGSVLGKSVYVLPQMI